MQQQQQQQREVRTGPTTQPKATPTICALYAIAVAVVRSCCGNHVAESSGGQLIITGPAAAFTP